MKIKIPYLLLLLLLFSYLTFIQPNLFLKPFYYIKDIIFSPVHAVNEAISTTKEYEESIINNLKEDIEELKKINNISLSISDYEIVNATIISRNMDYWFNTLTINKGLSDGIKHDMAVIDNSGLIGRISMVTKNTSEVKLITTKDTKNKVSAVIKNKDDDVYGIINGYDNRNNLLHLIITDNKKINDNSKVETTGMGGVFPRGILIGKVVDVIKKDDGVTNVVRVKPSGNIEGERYVSVLKRKEVSIN